MTPENERILYVFEDKSDYYSATVPHSLAWMILVIHSGTRQLYLNFLFIEIY